MKLNRENNEGYIELFEVKFGKSGIKPGVWKGKRSLLVCHIRHVLPMSQWLTE